MLTNHNKVINFNHHNGDEAYRGNQGYIRSRKKKYEKKIDNYMLAHGQSLFKRKQAIVFDELLFQTCVTGLQTISVATLERRTGASRRTVIRTVSKAEELGLFVVGYLRDGHKGKYVLVFRLHDNYLRIMEYVFGAKNVDNPVDDIVDNSALHPPATSNDTSNDMATDTSSNDETPCGCKDEAGKKVPTYSTCFTLETYDNVYTPFQIQLIELIKNKKEVLDLYKDHAECVISVLPKEMSSIQKDAFQRVLDNQMKRVLPKHDLQAYVSTMFKNEVQILEHKRDVEDKIKKQQSEFVFYDWVNQPKGSSPGISVINQGNRVIEIKEFVPMKPEFYEK